VGHRHLNKDQHTDNQAQQAATTRQPCYHGGSTDVGTLYSQSACNLVFRTHCTTQMVILQITVWCMQTLGDL
jgi:hypothetical protein